MRARALISGWPTAAYRWEACVGLPFIHQFDPHQSRGPFQMQDTKWMPVGKDLPDAK